MNQIDYLRISLIDRCNFRCQYCLPEDAELSYVRPQDLLTREEILTLVKNVFIPLGFRKFRLTGGEPLLHPEVVEIVRDIASLSATSDLALTTNGYLLDNLAEMLYEAGLRRINISLDSLDPDTFDKIIGNRGRSRWQKTWAGIQAAQRVGFDPLKLNVVVIPGINEAEVEDLAALTIEKRWHVRFIEFMPIGNGDLFQEKAWIANEELRAPVSGIISTTGVVSGQVVQARDLIFEVVNPSKLLIEALAYDSNLSKNIADGKVDVNGKVIELKYLGGGQTLREQALPLTFSAKSDDLQFLPIGQPIRVFVNTDSKVTGVKAPSKSLVKSSSNQTIVWIKKSPEIFEPRTVVYEPLDGQNIVITSGIKDGERVITDGASLINQIR
jgi:molybdenum cofactor biosynthesis enzyme MoaA